MANNWDKVKLGDISSDVSYGYTESATNEEMGPKFLRITDIQNGVVNWNTVPYCPIDDSRLKKYLLHKGDIVVARTGNSTGENYIFTGKQDTVYASYLIRFRIKEDVANPFFVWYSMRSPHWWAFIQGAKTGSAQAGANAKVLSSYSLKLPPIPEQKVIAHILGTLDDKIELNRQMNETLEAMAQALFKSWFVDFDPVIDNALLAGKAIPEPLKERAEMRQAQLDSGKAKTNSEINDLFPSEFEFTEELGWIPRGWRIRPLTEVIDFLEGPGIRNWQYTEEEDGIKFINIRCIQNGDINLKTANKITREEAFGKYKHFQLEIDDIIMSASGTLGRYAFVRQEHLPLSLNTSVIRFRPIIGVSTLYYIAGYIDTKLQWELETRASGSVQRNFGPMHLKKITMFVPDIDVLKEHARLSSEIFNKRRNNLEQMDTLIKLRDTLLPKLMSGELRIHDAEKLLEET